MTAIHPKHPILLLDDNTDIAEVYRLLLRSMGCETKTAVTVAEAVQLLDNSKNWSLILVDFLMPEMNGAQFVELIRKRFGSALDHVPIVAFTALDSRSHLIDEFSSYFTGIEEKPSGSDGFKKILETYIKEEEVR